MTDTAPLAEYPKTIVLKDGAHLVLRLVARGDRDQVAALLARVPAEQQPAIGITTTEPTILALDAEQAVAALGLARRGPEVATLALLVDPGYQGRRLGTWMLLDAVHLAASLGVVHLEAGARPGDTAYLAALRRLDFVAAPERSSASALVLVKTLHAAWTDF